MNKFFIAFLALCLAVTVHAFVKRDAPAPSNDNAAADFGKSMKEFLDNIGAKVSESLNPQEIMKNVKAGMDKFQQTINEFKPSSEPTKQ